jgi:hypothetical protein
MNAAFMRLRVSRRDRETSFDEAAETDEAQARFHLVKSEKKAEPGAGVVVEAAPPCLKKDFRNWDRSMLRSRICEACKKM